MKRSITLLLLFLGSVAAMGQKNIVGKVQDAQGEPIAYATVSLLTADSSLVTGAITDEKGAFNLNLPKRSENTGEKVETTSVAPRPLTPSPQAGRGSSPASPVVRPGDRTSMILQVSFIGYKTVARAIHSGDANLLITLQEESAELAEVEVKAKRQLIERQFDKIVLNVSNSPFAAGSNGKDLLKKAPAVQVVKDGNVTVDGKSVEVYIDGRPSYLSGDQLKAMLEGTDGSTIEKIEIISNPSAKYDAAGQGGIINIKTKRNMMQGLNGTLTASYGGMYYGDVEKWQNREMFSLNLNYRSEKTYTFATLTQLYVDQNIHVEVGSEALDTLTQTRTERYDESEYVCDFQYYMAKIGNDWFIDKKNTFGFIFQAPFMIMRQDVPE